MDTFLEHFYSRSLLIPSLMYSQALLFLVTFILGDFYSPVTLAHCNFDPQSLFATSTLFLDTFPEHFYSRLILIPATFIPSLMYYQSLLLLVTFIPGNFGSL
jgi:hypothetical protein